MGAVENMSIDNLIQFPGFSFPPTTTNSASYILELAVQFRCSDTTATEIPKLSQNASKPLSEGSELNIFLGGMSPDPH